MGTSSINTNAWLALTRVQPQALLRLFCFPYSGAGASIFYNWSESLPPTVEVCPVQLPGRGTRITEASFTRISPLVQALAPALLPYLDKPFAFFGHSMGALLSFELARYLRKHYGLLPAQLFVSGRGAPQLPDPEAPMHALPEAEFLERLRQLKGTPEEVLDHAELRQLLLPILRADFEVCETYIYEPDQPLECPISVYCGVEDNYVTPDRLEGWREQTTSSFTLRIFPGDHFYLNKEKQLLLQTLARELQELADSLSNKS